MAGATGRAGSLLTSSVFPLTTFVLGGITGAALLAALSRGPSARPALGPHESVPSGVVGPSWPSRGAETAASVGSPAGAASQEEGAQIAPPPLDDTAAEGKHTPVTHAPATGSQGERLRTAPEKVAVVGHAPQLATERRILDEARARLVQGDAARALGQLQRHRERFPKGLLAEERDAMQIEALAAQGRRDQARAAAAAFRTRSPNSLFIPTIESAIGAIPQGP